MNIEDYGIWIKTSYMEIGSPTYYHSEVWHVPEKFTEEAIRNSFPVNRIYVFLNGRGLHPYDPTSKPLIDKFLKIRDEVLKEERAKIKRG